MGESNLSCLQEPCALFEFNLSAPFSGSAAATPPKPPFGTGAGGAGGETVALEFNHAELYDFFLKLERMQEQLDCLS